MSPQQDRDTPKIVSRKIACENTKFYVYFDHVVDMVGGEVPEYLVVAPKIAAANMVTGVAILPILKNRVGLIRIYRPALRDYSLEIPHGFIDAGEEVQFSAIRELLEETGLQAKESEITSLGLITPDGGIIASRIHLFLAHVDAPIGIATHEMGLREFEYHTFTEFQNMVQRSLIQDSITLSAWCKYQFIKADVVANW